MILFLIQIYKFSNFKTNCKAQCQDLLWRGEKLAKRRIFDVFNPKTGISMHGEPEFWVKGQRSLVKGQGQRSSPKAKVKVKVKHQRSRSRTEAYNAEQGDLRPFSTRLHRKREFSVKVN